MRRITCLLFGFLIYNLTVGQDLISVQFKSNISKELAQLLVTAIGLDVKVSNGVDIFKVQYQTLGTDMKPDTASGLMMFPDTITGPLPIMCYQHGTTDGRSDVPSNLRGGYQLGGLFAALGMVCTAADFLGMGDSRGFHPYVNAETEASAAIDLLTAVKKYMDANNIVHNEQLFVSGYSQGGHAAMAAHQMLQDNFSGTYKVTASLPMSGPYSISGVMRDLAFTDDPYFFPAYLVYTTLGMKELDPTLYNDVSEIFREPFLNIIRQFERTGDGLFLLNQNIVQILQTNFGKSVPKWIFRDSILSIIENDPTHPFNRALADNDLYNWKPEAPVLMLYCRSDDQVPFRNSVIADSVMNMLGALDVSSMDVSNGLMLDHGECVGPALAVGVPWILSFIDTTVPTDEISAELSRIKLYPNPVSNYLFVDGMDGATRIEIFDLSARRMLYRELKPEENRLSTEDLQNGLYFLRIQNRTGENRLIKILVQH